MAQVWPAIDTFDDGTPEYGTAVRGYFGARLESGSTQFGRLHTGYGGAAAALGSGTSGQPAGWVRRQMFPEEQRVVLQARKSAASGTPLDTHLVRHGVIARMTDGTATQLSSIDGFTGATCYTFEVRQGTPGSFKFVIARYDAGVETILDQTTEVPSDAPAWASGHTLRLTAQTQGDGSVLLSGSILGVAAAALGQIAAVAPGGSGSGGGVFKIGDAPTFVGSVLKPPTTGQGVGGARADWMRSDANIDSPGGGVVGEDIVVVTDPAVTALTGSSRCGFLMDTESEPVSGTRIVSVSEVFEVADISAGIASPVVLWRDEWERAATPYMASVTDLHGTNGRDLTSDYGTDTGSTETLFLLRRDNVTANRVLQSGSIEVGSAPSLDGAGQTITLPDPTLVMPIPPTAINVAVTVALWANLTENRDGNGLYHAMDATLTNGFAMRWLDDGGGDAVIEMQLNAATYTTAPFDATPYVGQAHCFLFTYRANVQADGSGRLVVYVGRQGVATVLGTFVVPNSVRPDWYVSGTHTIGERVLVTPPGTDAARYLLGEVDHLSIAYREMTVSEVSRVCDELVTDGELLALGVVHAVDFDDNSVVSTTRYYKPWKPVISDATDSWRSADAVTLAAGLVSQIDESTLHLVHQRRANSINQRRTVDVSLPNTLSRGGVLLRAETFTGHLRSGYRVTLGVGAPGLVIVERVSDFEAVRIGSGSAGTVSLDTMTTIDVEASQLNPLDESGPVRIRVLVDDVPVVLEPTGFSGGVAIDSDDNLVDNDSERLISGLTTGVLVITDTGSDVAIDNWTEADLSTPTGADVGKSMSLPSESDGATGNLEDVLTPEWTVLALSSSHRIRKRMEDGRSLRRNVTTYERRLFRLTRTSFSSSEMDAFRAFWEAHGASVPFFWTSVIHTLLNEPGGTWAFVEDSFADVHLKSGARAMSVDVEERVAAS